MKDFFNNFLLYFQFLTRVPINMNLECSQDNFRRGIIFFPIVGVFIGICQMIMYFIFGSILPSSVVAVILILTPIMITGGLQIDGLGDTCDGFLAFKGGGKEKRIEIMKDSRIGTFAAIAIIFDFLFKFVLIQSAIDASSPWILFMAPILSRFSVVFISFIGKRAKENGTGNFYIQNVGKLGMLLVTLIPIVCGYFTLGISAVAITMGLCIILCYVFNRYCESKIGGQSGDTLGATNEIVEIISMMSLLALLI